MRAKLIGWSAVVVGVGIGICAGATRIFVEHEQIEALDDQLRNQAEMIFHELRGHRGDMDWNETSRVKRMLPVTKAERFIEISSADGALLYRSGNLKGRELDDAPGIYGLRIGRYATRFGVFENEGVQLCIAIELGKIHHSVKQHPTLNAAGPRRSPFANLGARIFSMRLYVGLVFALVGIEVLTPNAFMRSPHIASQVFGLLGVVFGLALRAWGTGCAGGHTRSGKIEGDRLVTGGPFAYVRNPIYAGSIVLGIGMSALIGDPLAYGLTGIAFTVLFLGIIPAEEKHLTQAFGAEYVRYCAGVPRLIPRWRRWPERSEAAFRWDAARGEWVIALIVAGIYTALQFQEYLDRIFPWA